MPMMTAQHADGDGPAAAVGTAGDSRDRKHDAVYTQTGRATCSMRAVRPASTEGPAIMKGSVRLLVTSLACAAVVVAVGSAAAPAHAADPPASPAPVAATATHPPYPSSLIVKSELRLKADLIRRNLDRSPQLVFFGGSRSQRFDPVFARRRTGLRAVNIALSCARPEAAWAYVNWFYKRWPDAQLRCVWGMQSGMLRDLELDPALLQDRRFYRYFPDDLLAQQRARLPDSKAKMPHTYGFLRNRYSSRGMLLWNRYDQRLTEGYTLRKALDAYIASMLHTAPDRPNRTRARAVLREDPPAAQRPRHDAGDRAHADPPACAARHEGARHGRRAEEAPRVPRRTLGETLDIKVLDFTTIGSFNGRADWFYDGVHITRRNANRVIVAAKAKARRVPQVGAGTSGCGGASVAGRRPFPVARPPSSAPPDAPAAPASSARGAPG